MLRGLLGYLFLERNWKAGSYTNLEFGKQFSWRCVCACAWISQGRILEWVAIFFFKVIFPTQGLNPCLLHCYILYCWATREAQCVYMNHFTVRKVLCEKKNEDQPWENQPLKNLHQPTNRDVGPRQSFKMRLNQAFLFNPGIHKPWTIICYYKYNLTLPCQAHPLINSWWRLLCCNSRVEQSLEKKKDCWLTKPKIFTIWFFTEYLPFGPSLF